MKKTLFSLFLLAFVIDLYGQKQGNVWYFGDHAGLNFNTPAPTPLLDGQTDFPLPNEWNEGSSVISDSSGSLLFYTNGRTIWNKQHQVMSNGHNLRGHSSSSMSSIIVPRPNSSRYFYVFTTDASEGYFQGGLRYSIVDMCLDNGLGGVMPIEKNVKLVDAVAEKLICVRHANDTDYWIITHKLNSDAFHAFRLTDNYMVNSGFAERVVSNTGTPDPQGWGGQMVASSDGTKIAYAIPNGQSFGKTLLLDFNAETGILSNERTLSTAGGEWGASFSPDNSKLYFSTTGSKLFQYDLNAGSLSEIIASKTDVIQNGAGSWRHHLLGADGKIYISRIGKRYLSVIENPNDPCPSCHYIDSAVYLGGRFASAGLPNFIAGYKYFNSDDAEYSCPTADLAGYSKNNVMSVYPNPFSTHTTLWLNSPLNNVTLQIDNIFGQTVKQIDNISDQEILISRSNLSDGVYFIRVIQDNEVIAIDKLVIE